MQATLDAGMLSDRARAHRAPRAEGNRVSTPLRYLLFQIPGWVVSAMVLVFLVDNELLSSRVALLVWGGWIVKDAVMYPLVRRAYEAGSGRHGGAALIGERGTVVRSIAPRGFVRVRGELWRAESEVKIAAGTEVEVVGAQGMRLKVHPKDHG